MQKLLSNYLHFNLSNTTNDEDSNDFLSPKKIRGYAEWGLPLKKVIMVAVIATT